MVPFTSLYLLRAVATDPKFGKLAYYLRYAAAQQGVKVIDGLTGPAQAQGNAFLMTLLDRLSTDKAVHHIDSSQEAADLAFITTYAGNLFKKADDSDRAGAADTGVGQSFATAGFLFDVVRSLSSQSGEEGANDPRLAQAAKYAKGRATDILTALKAGQMPPPPAGGLSESSMFADLGFDIPPANPAANPSPAASHTPPAPFAPVPAPAVHPPAPSPYGGGSEPMQGVSSASNTASLYGNGPMQASPSAVPGPYPSPLLPGAPAPAPGAGVSGSGNFGFGQAVSSALSSGFSYAQNQLASVAAAAAAATSTGSFGGAGAGAAPANLGPSPVWAKMAGGGKGGAGGGGGGATPLPAGKHGVSSVVMGDAIELTKHAMAALKEDDPLAAAAYLRQALGLLPASH